MKRWFFSAVAVFGLALYGCGDGSGSPVAPSGPAYSGGLVVGGNIVEPSDTTTVKEGDDDDDSGGLVVGGN